MPILSVKEIRDEDQRDRLTRARSAYLDDRFDESVDLSVNVYLDLMSGNPAALEGTRLDSKNRFAAWPDYGVTLENVGTPELSAVRDGRKYTMAPAVCYFEYALEAVILAQDRAKAAV